MNTTCSSEFMNKGCLCLSDPVDPLQKVCAYINFQNGTVRPCDPGCCAGECPTIGSFPNLNTEYRRSAGSDLPSGYGTMLETSDLPTENPKEAMISGPSAKLAPPPSDLPVFQKNWQLLLFLSSFLVVILVVSFTALKK